MISHKLKFNWLVILMAISLIAAYCINVKIGLAQEKKDLGDLTDSTQSTIAEKNNSVPVATLSLISEHQTPGFTLSRNGSVAASNQFNFSKKVFIRNGDREEQDRIALNIYNVNSGKLLHQILNSNYRESFINNGRPNFQTPYPIIFSPDDRILVVIITSKYNVGIIHLYDVATGKPIGGFSCFGPIKNADMRAIVHGKVDYEKIPCLDEQINLVAYSWNGNMLAAASDLTSPPAVSREGSIRIWDVNTGKLLFAKKLTKEYIKYTESPEEGNFKPGFIFSRDGKYIHWQGGCAWNIETGEQLSKAELEKIFAHQIDCVAFNPDGSLGVKINENDYAEIINIDNGEVLRKFSLKDFAAREEIVGLDSTGNVIITTRAEPSKEYQHYLVVRQWQLK